MAYTPQEWRDGDEGTPLSAERMLHIENGIAAKAQRGPAGTDGADGFPTEADWNDLVARVEALEDPDE